MAQLMSKLIRIIAPIAIMSRQENYIVASVRNRILVGMYDEQILSIQLILKAGSEYPIDAEQHMVNIISIPNAPTLGVNCYRQQDHALFVSI